MPVVQTELTIPARDGYRVAATLRQPEQARAAVLISSATAFPRQFYGRFANWLAEHGAVVLTYDYRGIGGSRPDDLAALDMDYPDWGRLDLSAALDALVEAAPDLTVGHVGHSVGGHFVGFASNHDRIDRHAFVSVGTGWWGGHHRRYNPAELFFWFGYGPFSLARHGYVKGGGLWSGTDLPRGVYATWRRWCMKRAYFHDELADGRLDPHHFDSVTAPIRSWIFPDDPIATVRTAADLLKVYPAAPVEIVSRAAADYGLKRIGHEGAFRRGMEPLWEEILVWLTPADLSKDRDGG